MKVIVDLTLCDLHGLCVDTAPEVFEIATDGALKVLMESPPEAMRARVEKSVRECPTGAISIVD
jgi:ferredoxin